MSDFQILKLPEVEAMVCLKHSTIYDKIDNGTFPPPIKLSKRSVGWLLHEIQAWIESRIEASRPSRPGGLSHT